jgi:hypothetical protein
MYGGVAIRRRLLAVNIGAPRIDKFDFGERRSLVGVYQNSWPLNVHLKPGVPQSRRTQPRNRNTNPCSALAFILLKVKNVIGSCHSFGFTSLHCYRSLL